MLLMDTRRSSCGRILLLWINTGREGIRSFLWILNFYSTEWVEVTSDLWTCQQGQPSQRKTNALNHPQRLTRGGGGDVDERKRGGNRGEVAAAAWLAESCSEKHNRWGCCGNRALWERKLEQQQIFLGCLGCNILLLWNFRTLGVKMQKTGQKMIQC